MAVLAELCEFCFQIIPVVRMATCQNELMATGGRKRKSRIALQFTTERKLVRTPQRSRHRLPTGLRTCNSIREPPTVMTVSDSCRSLIGATGSLQPNLGKFYSPSELRVRLSSNLPNFWAIMPVNHATLTHCGEGQPN